MVETIRNNKGSSMKICIVGPANSAHIVKWCTWFVGRGHEVHVISFTPGEIQGVEVHLIDIGVNTNGSDIGKLKYLFTGKDIKRNIEKIMPDVISVHYATSYGVAVALSGVKGYVLSVWGSDIYDFPNKSPLHKALLKYSLRKADTLFSTSKAMADEAAKYTDKKFEITPFGVDMDLFNPNKRTRNDSAPFTIGTVKTLSDLYGIDYILKAASIIKNDYKNLAVSVRISGEGPQKNDYKKLVKDLGIEDITLFLGKISQEKAAEEWANMDVAIIPSTIYESFGVSAVEAQASGTPVIISDVDGLLEATNPGKSSTVVPKKDFKAIADAIVMLYEDPVLRKRMGMEGRRYASEKYELNTCFQNIESSLSTKGGGVLQDSIIIEVCIKRREDFIVGTVKGLSDKYGIKHILEATAEVKKYGDIPIKLRIAGSGIQEQEYKRLAETLGIEDITTWLGYISQEQAAVEWANMDIGIIPSTLESESFGVSAVEAQACGTPVIISDIPGLMEATKPGESSIVVKRNDSEGISVAISDLFRDCVLRKVLSKKGLSYVQNRYELNACFEHIEELFDKIVNKKGSR